MASKSKIQVLAYMLESRELAEKTIYSLKKNGEKNANCATIIEVVELERMSIVQADLLNTKA